MASRPHHGVALRQPVIGSVPATEPYPWPWRGLLDPGSTALVVVTSPQPPEDVAPLAKAIATSASALRSAGVAIAELRTAPPFARRAQLSGERMSLLDSAAVDYVVEPQGWDGFHGTPLDAILRAQGRDTLILVGWWFEIAVHSTMRSANDKGYECLLATDMVAGLEAVTTAAAISSIHMSGGIFGATGLGSDAVAALTAASQPHVEEISA